MKPLFWCNDPDTRSERQQAETMDEFLAQIDAEIKAHEQAQDEKVEDRWMLDASELPY